MSDTTPPTAAELNSKAMAADQAANALDREVESKTQQAAVMRGHNLEAGAQGVAQQAVAAKKKAAVAREQAADLRAQVAKMSGAPSGVPPAAVLTGLALLWWAFGPKG